MRRAYGTKLVHLGRLGAVPLLAVLIGIGLAIASSLGSLTQDHRSVAFTPLPSPTPSLVPTSPIPTVTQPGLFVPSPHLQAWGSSGLSVQGANLAAGSADGGTTWPPALSPPSKSAGIAIDGTSPLRGITGGATIQFTIDGGKRWQPAQTSPRGTGPYLPLAISPFDGSVWFFIRQGKLLRTRDGSLTWREEFTELPTLTNPVMAPGRVVGEFFLGSGNRVFQLIDNGQRPIVEEPLLPPDAAVIELATVGGSQATLLARTSTGLYLLRGNAWSALTGVTWGPIGAGSDGVLLVGNGGGRLDLPGAVAYSVDLGKTWRQGQGLPSEQSVEAIAGQPGSTNFFAYCYGGDIYSSSDGGHSWTVLTRALRRRTG